MRRPLWCSSCSPASKLGMTTIAADAFLLVYATAGSRTVALASREMLGAAPFLSHLARSASTLVGTSVAFICRASAGVTSTASFFLYRALEQPKALPRRSRSSLAETNPRPPAPLCGQARPSPRGAHLDVLLARPGGNRAHFARFLQ